MANLASISIHPSQFPDRIRGELVDNLRRRELNHKFLYDGLKQTQKWLALHQACSPSRTDEDCAATYDKAFQTARGRLKPGPVRLVGLGCGGGQKDTRFLHLLSEPGRTVSYTPVDVSPAMVLTARQCALAAMPGLHCTPFVCDLAAATDLESALDEIVPKRAQRVLTFFGMMPNFEPDVILPQMRSLMRRGDLLLISANLAPGLDYDQGVRRVLALYDNKQTKEWLWSFILDLGIEATDGELRFDIENGRAGLKRITAHFCFERDCQIRAGNEQIDFSSGDRLRVFFSYRHTPDLMRRLLSEFGLEAAEQWITASGEEGVFLVEPKPPRVQID